MEHDDLKILRWQWLCRKACKMLVAKGDYQQVRTLLRTFDYLQAKTILCGPFALLDDFALLRGDITPDDSEQEELVLLEAALRLSTPVLERDPNQLAGQLLARLPQAKEVPAGLSILCRHAAVWTGGGPPGTRNADSRCAWLRPRTSSLDVSQNGMLLRTYSGHQCAVTSIAVTNIGRNVMVVSGGQDGNILVWDPLTGEDHMMFHGHTGMVTAIAPAELIIATGSADGTARVWDSVTGGCNAPIAAHETGVLTVSLTPDGATLFTAARAGLDAAGMRKNIGDGDISVRETSTGRVIQKLKGHRDSVCAIAVTADARRCISASFDETLIVWDLETGQQQHCLRAGYGRAEGVVLFQEGRYAASYHADLSLRLWDMEVGSELDDITGFSLPVTALAVVQDGTFLVAGTTDGMVLVWDMVRWEPARYFQAHTESVNAIAIIPEGRRIVTCSNDLTVKVWSLEAVITAEIGDPIRDVHTECVNALVVTPDGQWAVSGAGSEWKSSDNSVRVWNMTTGTCAHTVRQHGKQVLYVGVTPDGLTAFSRDEDGATMACCLETGEITAWTPGDMYLRSTSAKATPSGGLAVLDRFTAIIPGLGRPGEPSSYPSLRVIRTEGDRVFITDTDATGTHVASRELDGDLDPFDRKKLGHTYRPDLRPLAISHDGRYAVAGLKGGVVRVWDAASGNEVWTFGDHVFQALAVAITANGGLVASAGYDHRVVVWDVVRKTKVAEFTGDGMLSACAFTPKETGLVIGDAVGRLHFLDIVTPHVA